MASPARDARLAAAANGFTEITARGRGSLVTRNPNTGKFSLDTQVGGVGWHYGTDYASEVDSAWETSTNPAWQWQMVKAEHNLYARNVLNAGDTIQWLDPSSGESITLQPLALNWVDNVTDSRQQITQPQAVTATPDGDALTWADGYGTGRHFRYISDTAKLIKHLIIDSAANLPAPTVANPYLEIEFILKKSAGVTEWIDTGNGYVQWDRSTKTNTAKAIQYRLSNGTVVWSFADPTARDSASATNHVAGIFQLRRQGASRYCTVRIPKTWTDQAVYPIFIDPTIDVNVGANADDGYIEPPSTFNAGSSYFGYYYGVRHGWLRFTGISGLSGATITTSYISNSSPTKLGSPNAVVYANDVAAPTAPTTYAEYTGKALTAASASWTGVASPSPSLNSIIQELADSYDPSAIMIMPKDNGSAANENFYSYYGYDYGGTSSLHIEYTAAAASLVPSLPLKYIMPSLVR